MRISLKHWLRLRRDPWRKIFYDAYRQWKRDKMEAKRYVFEGLNIDSVVFDVGGFEGNWAQDIYDRYGSTIHVFEPHPTFAAALEKRFAKNPKIVVHAFALGSEAGQLHLSDDGDASSAVNDVAGSVSGEVRPVAEFMKEFEPPVIDMMKINIEGGEYDLLPALAASGDLSRFGIVQVQFHQFRESDGALRDAVRADLAKTHSEKWCYPFVWEEWHRA
ncbi:FkbM family methyltransferase [Litoreibacter halocynthiae]|uniref:FkbM family methyltransferase n=1 Tax=Litoreibacter halocynthiae TaxID=1242689 RepID=UPI0024935CCB|nr:FkbM family methyltransferase [Litoreibacter halocynthiae]